MSDSLARRSPSGSHLAISRKMINMHTTTRDLGFPRTYTPTLMDGPVFRWTTYDNGRRSTEVSASRNGVIAESGPFALTGKPLDSFLKLVVLANHVHQQLAQKVPPSEIDFSITEE